MSRLCIYHANCFDGFCAAWLFNAWFPYSEFFAAQYGQEPPDVKGKDVFILDFSYKRPVMEQIIKDASFTTVLDHHKTAQAELEDLYDEKAYIKFDMNKSGGMLTWEYLINLHSVMPPGHFMPITGEPPWLVKYTMDRDLWLWKLPNSREINAALRSYTLDFRVWNRHHLNKREDYIEPGSAILRVEQQMVNEHVKHVTHINLNEFHNVPCVNATCLFSEIAGKLAENAFFGACYFIRSDGLVQFSLRSKGDFDVSDVAKAFGGGGHKNAAGFQVPLSFLENLVHAK